MFETLNFHQLYVVIKDEDLKNFKLTTFLARVLRVGVYITLYAHFSGSPSARDLKL